MHQRYNTEERDIKAHAMLSVNLDLLVHRLHMLHHIYLAMLLWQTSVTVASMI